MRRLYLQIYLTFVAILLLLGVSGAAAWLWWMPREDGGLVDTVAAVVEQLLPGAEASQGELETALESLSERFDVSLALFGSDGSTLAVTEEGLPRPRSSWTENRVLPSRGRGLTMALRLSDGRWVVVRHRRDRHVLGALAGIVLAALAVGLGSYPLVRRLTRRLERLHARVDALGEGRLDARVEVEGQDEVAKLALSFNRAAARIERLVEGQRTLLAGASHELRTPLTRIRVAVALVGESAPLELRNRIDHDICELDELIGELILASRLEASEALGSGEVVDILALAAEEAVRYQADVSGVPVEIPGDRALLRRLLRNLLENAARYAPGAPAEIDVRRRRESGEGAVLRVMDRGDGVPDEERDRLFEPFYQLKGPSGTHLRSERGVGLGLALVRRIARLHGGDARCLARDGGGTIFEVELPGGEALEPKRKKGR